MENEIKEIHLFLLEKCDHTCKLCCNKQYEIDKIPVITVDELKQAETILFTGGEPFLIGNELSSLARRLKTQYSNIKNIYVYTSGPALLEYLEDDDSLHCFDSLRYFDGISIAPKNKYDMICLDTLFLGYNRVLNNLRSNRIYMFPEFKDKIEDLYNSSNLCHIELIDRKWQETFEPGLGVFRRLPILY